MFSNFFDANNHKIWLNIIYIYKGIYIYTHTYSCAHKFTCLLQNMQNVNNFNKIGGIMKIACYCLLNTVLNKLFQITDVYILSTRQNNNWIYKKWPRSKVYIPLNLITMCHFLDDPQLFLCFVIVAHESLVGPEQLNCLLFFRKILQLLYILWFSNIFCIFEPFPTVTVWFWDPSFHTEGNWGTHA